MVEKCQLASCGVEGPPDQMQRVEIVFDGQPLVGFACSEPHAQQLVQQWRTGDRSSPAHSLWSEVGCGRVAA